MKRKTTGSGSGLRVLRTAGCILLLLAATTACTGKNTKTATTTQDQKATKQLPVWERTTCWFDIPEANRAECGYIRVPENRRRENNKTIMLAVAVLKATTKNVQPDPVYYLDGGPGGGATPFAGHWFERAAPLLEQRDLVLIDQRGTGYSIPNLTSCASDSGLGFLSRARTTDKEYDPVGDAKACATELKKIGIDLAGYSSAQNAADIELVRRVLKHQQINLYGISYGTRLAQTVVRDFPEHIRTIILDGVLPLNIPIFEKDADVFRNLVQNVLADCNTQPDCNAAFGQTTFNQLDAVYKYMADFPATISAPAAITQTDIVPIDENGDMVVEPYYLVNALMNLFYVAPELLPALIAKEANGNHDWFTPYLQALATKQSVSAAPPVITWNDRFLSWAMFRSVVCSDIAPFTSFDAIQEAFAPYPYLVFWANLRLESVAVCDVWPHQPKDTKEFEAVTSDLPTLVFNGRYDYQTPVEWSGFVTIELDNYFAYTFSSGHGASVVMGQCPQKILAEFLNAPKQRPVESCPDEQALPQFALSVTDTDFAILNSAAP